MKRKEKHDLWKKRMEAYEASGQTKQELVSKQDEITEYQFHYWRKKIKAEVNSDSSDEVSQAWISFDEGIAEAQRVGEEFGIQVITGIEISTKYKGKSIDKLGYNMTEGEELTNILLRMREGREERAKRIVDKLNEIGFTITLEEVKEFSEDGLIAKPHIAKAIVKKGYVVDYQTVFDDYLVDGKPCAIDKVVLSPKEGIRLIHKAGGKAVLAHPIYIGDDNMVLELLTLGFDGIEVWHRSQNKADNEKYKLLATEFGLLMTGGLDFHNDTHQLGQFGI